MATYTVRGDVGVLLIDNPPVNALSVRTAEELLKGLHQSAKDDTTALVLCGNGRQFSAGADVSEFDIKNEVGLGTLIKLTMELEANKKPVVAAIHGYAFGGGLEIALSCHYRVAQSNAKVGLPEVKLGVIPAAGGTQRLPRLVGLDVAMEWISSGKSYPVTHAQKLGIIDLLVPENEDVRASAIGFARQIAKEPLIGRRTSLISIKGAPDADRIADKHLVAINKKARGQVSPLACIQAVRFAAKGTFSEGLKNEAEIFKTLVTSGKAQGMIHSFFGERDVQKWSVANSSISWKTTKPLKIRKGAVIGLGTMGRGITINFLKAGIPVVVIEQDKEYLESGLQSVHQIIEAMAQHQVISPEQAEKMKMSIVATMDYAALRDADLVIEAVFEEIEIKKEVFQKLDAVCKSSTVLASNTSALDIDKIASFTKRPDQVMGMHFFAPPDRMTLLENVYGAKTSPQTIATCMDVGRKMGKVAVLVGNCYGFVANRMYMHYMNEADFLLEEGAYPQDVDKALTDYGFAMGRFLVGDLAGNDVNYRVRRAAGMTVEHQLPGAPERERNGVRYCPLADYLCAKRRYGFKTGKGWHNYHKNGVPVPSPEVIQMIDEYRRRNGINPRRIDSQEAIERTLYPLINEGFKALDEGFAAKPVDIDMIWIHGYAWPRHTGGPMFYASTVGLPKVLEVLRHHYKKFGDTAPHWKPSEMLVKLVEKHGNPPIEKWMTCASASPKPYNANDWPSSKL